MTGQTKSLAHQAMLESIEVRDEWDRELDGPLDIYALCEDMGVTVRFVDIPSMEGLYGRDDDGRASILLSSLRPLPRRAFSCAHELGHHVFGHGSSVDEIADGAGSGAKRFQPNEFLADTFAGFLLMPTLGVRKAFASRGWSQQTASPSQVYTIACHFGVGYETLIGHMAHALQSISGTRADELRKVGPKAIREQLLGSPAAEALIVADEQWGLQTVDAEVGMRILLPSGVKADEGAAIVAERIIVSCRGELFRAARPGIVRVARMEPPWAAFVRVARHQFSGLARYRHLELAEDDDA